MAKLTGGLHGRPAGNVGGIVYGAARTRIGKAVTARELVIPSNPDTADQRLQRTKFSLALQAVRDLAAAVWKTDWNRAIGQLPGFQSMMSIILMATDDDYVLTTPPTTPLGTLYSPASLAVEQSGSLSGAISVTWTAETGGNGTAADVVKILAILKHGESEAGRPAFSDLALAVRSTGAATFDGLVATFEYMVAVWFVGVGDAVGYISPAKWYEVRAGA